MLYVDLYILFICVVYCPLMYAIIYLEICYINLVYIRNFTLNSISTVIITISNGDGNGPLAFNSLKYQ